RRIQGNHMSLVIGQFSYVISRTASKLGKMAGTVALALLAYAVQIEDTHKQVSGGHRLPVEMDVSSALEFPVQAADEEMRHVIVLVLIGIAHVGAMDNQAMIQKRAVAVGRNFQFVGQIGR